MKEVPKYMEEAKRLLRYNPETGELTIKVAENGRQKAAYMRTDGYLGVCLCNSRYLAHRVIWYMHYGEVPGGFIDHINRDRSDNRICNLRLTTRLENNQNKFGPYKNNTVGLPGITNQKGKYRARIRVNCKLISLGYFDTKEEAYEAYLAAKRKYHKTATIQDKAA